MSRTGKKDDSGQNTFNNVMYSLGGNLLPPLFGLISMPLVLNHVGPERFGVFALIMASATYFAVFDLGVGRGTTYFVSRNAARRPLRAARTIKVAASLQRYVGIVLGVCWLLIAPILVNYILTVPPSLKTETLYAFWITGLCFPFVLGVSVSRGAMEGVGRFDLSNKLRIGTSFLIFLTPALISYLTPSMIWIALGMLFGRVLTFVLYEVNARRLFQYVNVLPRRLFGGYCRRLIGYGGWIMLAVVLGTLMTMGYLDRFVVGSLSGLKAVTTYAIPSEMAVRILLVPGAISGIFFSQVAKQEGLTRASVRTFNRKIYLYLVAGSLPLVIVLFLLREEILRLLMGSQYDPASLVVFSILLIGVFFNALAHAPYTLLQASGNPRATAMRHVVQLPVYIVAACFFTKRFGLYGTATVWMVWAVTDYLLLLALTRKGQNFCREVAG